jgi:hypothetical protein
MKYIPGRSRALIKYRDGIDPRTTLQEIQQDMQLDRARCARQDRPQA